MVDFNEIQCLAEEFKECRKFLVAIGDEERQNMIVSMALMNQPCGVCVNEITRHTNLSRPAVSHHLKILRDAGIVQMRKEGTHHYYYFDENAEVLDKVIAMLSHARDILKSIGTE